VRKIIAASLFAFLVVGGSTVRAGAVDPPQGSFHERYFSVYLGPTKCGWARYEFVRQGDTIVTRNDLLLKIARADTTFTLTHRAETQETLDGKPLRFYSKADLGGIETVHRGTVADGQVAMTISQAGQSAEHKFALPDDALMWWGQHLLGERMGLKPGVSFSMTIFDPELGPSQFITARIDVVGPVKSEVFGREVEGTRVLTSFDKPLPIQAASILDADGYEVITEVPIGPMKLTLVGEPREKALAGIGASELFLEFLIRPERPIALPEQGPVRYRITYEGDNTEPFDLIETAMQRVVKREKDQIILEVSPGGTPKKSATTTQPASPEPRYTRDSLDLNLEDPLLVRLASENIDQDGSDLEKARKLCQFVSGYITTKDLSTGYAPAAQVAKTRQGDCTEHSLLLAALGRIVGIPTRGVNGLAYVAHEGTTGAFIGHMWTQFFIDGQWVDLDPALGQLEPDQGNIALTVSDLSDTSMQQQASVLRYLGQLKVEQMELAQTTPK